MLAIHRSRFVPYPLLLEYTIMHLPRALAYDGCNCLRLVSTRALPRQRLHSVALPSGSVCAPIPPPTTRDTSTPTLV